jgi:serine/threonine-protein kinase
MTDVNQDLLLAVLALLTGSVPRDALRAALTTWSQGPDRSLATLLKEQGTLDDSRLQALECLVSAHLRNHNGDIQSSLDAWNAQALTQDMVTELEQSAPGTTLGATLAETLGLTLPAQPAGEARFGERPELPNYTQEQRFEVIRPHAKGGIGQVWVARDRELQREVALKEIQPRFAERNDQRARFLLEAEITGNLEHPGIVPVYSLGSNADGRPYYAMRFIRGDSLSVAIKQFHKTRQEQQTSKRGKRIGSPWGVEFQQLLRRFLDVCDAMEYAHSRGVIHRDLKPGNIMLGPYGETLVVDWGLAKVIGKSDIVPVHVESGAGGDFDQGTAGATANGAGETQPGTTIGTPSYMSPEQACGDLDQLGPASDVYSLGATLYELLTGTFPFPGEKPSEIIAKVKKGELNPPRALVPSIPPPLEAICLKAMAFRPEQRYQSARELALDLEHWIADEPVAASPDRRLQKLSRWLRRHRTWTYAAAAALVGITVVATVAVVVVEGSRRSEAEARKEAEANFNMAQQAVEEYLTNVSENTLLKEQDSLDIGSLRKDLLQTALKYYEQFVNQRSHDPQLRKDLANAHYRVGEIAKEIDSPTEALRAYRSALSLWDQLVKEDPESPELQYGRALTFLAMAGQQSKLDQFQDALAALTQARPALEGLTARFPTVATYQSRLSSCYRDIGVIQSRLEIADGGLGLLERARNIQRRVVERNPEQVEFLRSMAEVMNSLGFVYYYQGNYSAAQKSFEEVQAICSKLLDRVTIGPKPIRYQELLALGSYNTANIQVRNKETRRALESYERALKYWLSLVQSHPSIGRFRESLGTTYRELASVQQQEHLDSQALESIRRSQQIYQELVQSQPDRPELHFELGRTLNFIGLLYDEAKQNLRAIPPLLEAIAEQKRAIAISSSLREYKFFLSYYLENLGEQYVDLGQVERGMPYYRDSARIRGELNDAKPDNREYALGLVDTLAVIGNIQRHAGDPAAATRSLERAQAVLSKWHGRFPGDAELQGRYGFLLNQQGETMADSSQFEQARALLEKSVIVLESALNGSPDQPLERRRLAQALWDLARVLRAIGRGGDAARVDARRASLWTSQTPEDLVELAKKQAAQANLIGSGNTPISAPAQVVRKLDDDYAVAILRGALARGFKDLNQLKTNPDISLVLERAAINPLRLDQELPEPPFQDPP